MKEIVRRTIGRRAVYDVELDKNNAPNPRLYIAEDGTIVRNAAAKFRS